MYLRTILELEEEGYVPMRARIAERLEHSGPTVSQTIARMERDGLVNVSGDRHLELTVKGRKEAVEVMRKHRLAERLLADVIGLEWDLVHEEACRWEHVMSEQVERKILQLISTPEVSPYGNPIPGLEALGHGSNPPFKSGVTSIALLDASALKGRVFTLSRIGEPAQTDTSFLANLKDLGLLPGVAVEIEKHEKHWLLIATDREEGLELEPALALHLFVAEQ